MRLIKISSVQFRFEMSRKLIPLTKDITGSESFAAARSHQNPWLSGKSNERTLGEKVKAIVTKLSGAKPTEEDKSSMTNVGPKDSATNVIGII